MSIVLATGAPTWRFEWCGSWKRRAFVSFLRRNLEESAVARCPTCGSHLPDGKALGPEALLQILQHAHPHREVYRSDDGDWWVTYGGGQADPRAVRLLV